MSRGRGEAFKKCLIWLSDYLLIRPVWQQFCAVVSVTKVDKACGFVTSLYRKMFVFYGSICKFQGISNDNFGQKIALLTRL